MKRLTKRDIQRNELNILIAVKEICNSNNLKFYLSGGTLLGAIRHRGFIPWDDDIDVCMPRADYEKLKNANLKEEFESIEVYKSDTLPFIKLVDKNVRVLSQYGTLDNYLWIDIFPVDALPDDINSVRKIYKKAEFYRRLLYLGKAKLGEGKNILKKVGKYFIKPFVKLYSEERLTRKLEQLALEIPYESSNYVGAITGGLYGEGERMLKIEFEKSIFVTFEGYDMPTMSCWDSYLKGIYGDYMKLPPEDKRKTHDMLVYSAK